MNIFKIAFKTCRSNSKLIYKGFGFRHLSDATQYYVHPDNRSFKGTTTLSQPIGEAMMLLHSMLLPMTDPSKGKTFGDFYSNTNKDEYLLETEIPQDYHDNGIIDGNICSYKAFLKGSHITVASYSSDGQIIPGNVSELKEGYKLLPSFMLLIFREMEKNVQYRALMEKFLETPNPDAFVNLCEDIYQTHKSDDYRLTYGEIPAADKKDFSSLSASYEIIRENKQELSKEDKGKIRRFPKEDFSEEQLRFLPLLSDEFVLPAKLGSLCNAITQGDIMAALFHGPAGTGKTMSCKLVCRETGLPIMETINCTENLDEFVLGKFIPEDDRIIFKESCVTKAIREGGAVIFEEINFAKPQYLAFLNSLLDDNGFVRLDNGDIVRRHRNFRFFATMNIGYFGTKELNQSLYNRFSAIVEMAELSDEAILRMLTMRVPECKPVADKIISVYHKLRKKIEAEELDAVISPRNLENWARMAKYEGYMSAAEKTIIPIAKCDRVLEQAIRGILMIYKWK